MKSIAKEIKVKTDWSNTILKRKNAWYKPIIKTTVDLNGKIMPDNSFLLEHLLSEDECSKIIEEAEKHSFGKTNYDQKYRSNLRLITVDMSLSELLYSRLVDFIPQQLKNKNETWKISGLNECFRLSKYNKGNAFDIHLDTEFKRKSNERSFYTVNIYLNFDYTGGKTRFYDKTNNIIASIKTEDSGTALIFMQPPLEMLLHDGEPVEEGIKYLLRTDVMYVRID